MSSGCGCKEVYRFPHTTYPYSNSSCICFFLQQHPYFLLMKKKSFIYNYIYCRSENFHFENLTCKNCVEKCSYKWGMCNICVLN